MTSLMERLEALVAAANEPPPKSSPEQDSRAGEAMAGVEDQRRFARWADRVDDAQRQLVALAPELLAGRQSLSDRIDVLEGLLCRVHACRMEAGEGRFVNLSKLRNVMADIDAALHQEGIEP